MWKRHSACPASPSRAAVHFIHRAFGVSELMPCPDHRYYLDRFTMDQKHKGKSGTFTWQ
jgi:hypothetical protein